MRIEGAVVQILLVIRKDAADFANVKENFIVLVQPGAFFGLYIEHRQDRRQTALFSQMARSNGQLVKRQRCHVELIPLIRYGFGPPAGFAR